MTLLLLAYIPLRGVYANGLKLIKFFCFFLFTKGRFLSLGFLKRTPSHEAPPPQQRRRALDQG